MAKKKASTKDEAAAQAKVNEKKTRMKNSLNQVLPVQLFDADGKLYQRNLTRKETFHVGASEITPVLQRMIDCKLIRVR